MPRDMSPEARKIQDALEEIVRVVRGLHQGEVSGEVPFEYMKEQFDSAGYEGQVVLFAFAVLYISELQHKLEQLEGHND